MINEKDVIRMKIPFPSIHDTLAVQSHMYICKKSFGHKKEFLKCQTLKPYMLRNSPIIHYYDEAPDITRNPFRHTTRIDCDKIFYTSTVIYDSNICTNIRRNICDGLHSHLLTLLQNYAIYELDEESLIELNEHIHAV